MEDRLFRPGFGIIIAGVALLVTVMTTVLPTFALTPQHPLEHVPFERLPSKLMVDSRIFDQRQELVAAIDRTVEFLRTEEGKRLYAAFGERGLDVRLVEQSIQRFGKLLITSRSHDELVRRIRESFDLYRSTGNDGKGTVRFTGYFRPVYQASRIRTKSFPYPLFQLPEDYETWPTPHPTRVQLEGFDGKGGRGTLLWGNELAYVRSRFEAFMIHVQGSAVLEYPDDERQAIGFAEGTNYPFRGISGDFLRKHRVAWGRLNEFFETNPQELNQILSRNNRFIFFSDQIETEPMGSLGLPVTAERSIAIDQGKLPPGAISIIRTTLPSRDGEGKLRMEPTSRFVLNLDSGSAIRGAGRVDVFMGTGEEARLRANSVYGNGQLYYLVAKHGSDGLPSSSRRSTRIR